MMRQACKIVGFSIFFLSSGVFAAGEETVSATKTWTDYKIITDRNIFSRYRTKTVPMSQVQQQVVVVPEQSYYTLRGITRQSDGYISFIEDSRTAALTRSRQGDSIAGGRITGINMDCISYENGGKTLKVEIGMNLEGLVVSAGMQYLSSGSGRSQGNGGFPGIGQSQGLGQMPGMGQSQPSEQGAEAGQTPSNGQQQGVGWRRQATGQTQSTGRSAAEMQPQAAGQSQPTGQSGATGRIQRTANSSSAGQEGTSTVQPVTGTQQQGADSDDIVQRLKERRKKELE
jgi:hypothetical protein